ncbi:MAG TPA: serine protease, partial [Rhodospirillaceae bacterium]|nr:serine protease [Rhodospirillaceae bacterium]
MEVGPGVPGFPHGTPFDEFFEEFMGPRGLISPPVGPATSLGSGFVVDAEQGYVVTNAHVVRDADEIRVTFHDDTTVEAQVVGADDKTDIAVLKVPSEDKALQALAFGDSRTMRVGDWVLAIGNPFGLGGSVTAGIISARARDVGVGPYDDFLQTDAAINRGNSGGPVLSMDGQVVGVSTAIFSPSGGSIGIGFATPAEIAAPVVQQLLDYGHTRRGWIGVKVQSVDADMAASFGLDSARGALVAEVTPGGPAEAAGLKQGDIIVSFGGQAVGAMRDLPRMVAGAQIGAEATVVYWRDGAQYAAQVTLAELEKAEASGLLAERPTAAGLPEGGSAVLADLGVTVADITPTLRARYSLPEGLGGVVVTALDPARPLLATVLAEGDVVVEIARTPVTTAAQAASLVADARQAAPGAPVLLLI